MRRLKDLFKKKFTGKDLEKLEEIFEAKPAIQGFNGWTYTHRYATLETTLGGDGILLEATFNPVIFHVKDSEGDSDKEEHQHPYTKTIKIPYNESKRISSSGGYTKLRVLEGGLVREAIK